MAGLTAGPSLGDPPADPGRDFGVSHRPVCPPAAPETARCHAQVVSDGVGRPLATTSYSIGYQPANLAIDYKLPTSGTGQTVAIVDAYDNPTAEADLAAYRTQFGLPDCTS